MQKGEIDPSCRCVVMHKKLWRTETEMTETDVRKNKSDIRIKFFNIKINKNFPREAGNGMSFPEDGRF